MATSAPTPPTATPSSTPSPVSSAPAAPAPSSMSRVPQQSVVLHRKGQQIVPPIGQPFDFTAAELADIERVNPDAITALAVVDLSMQPQDQGL